MKIYHTKLQAFTVLFAALCSSVSFSANPSNNPTTSSSSINSAAAAACAAQSTRYKIAPAHKTHIFTVLTEEQATGWRTFECRNIAQELLLQRQQQEQLLQELAQNQQIHLQQQMALLQQQQSLYLQQQSLAQQQALFNELVFNQNQLQPPNESAHTTKGCKKAALKKLKPSHK